MEPGQFSKATPGELVRIAEGWAYLPAPLPPDLVISPAILHDVELARGALGEFVGQTRLVQNPQLIMAPLQHREAVLSSRIEGTHTEVEQLLRAEALSDVGGLEDSDLQEVLNYLRALRHGQEWVTDGRPMNHTFVRELHRELMSGVRGQDKRPGEYRNVQVYIGNRGEGIRQARFVPPPPQEVQVLMDALLAFAGGEPAYGQLMHAALLHYQFEVIHPFGDGNGRIGRLLIPLQLTATGTLDRPYLYVSAYFEAHRERYIDLLYGVSTRGAWEDWILFFLDAVRSQAIDSRNRVQQVLDLHSRYRTEAADSRSTKTAILAIDHVMERVFVTVPGVAKATTSTYPTAKNAVERLVELGILMPLSGFTGAQIWEARELLDLVYRA